MGSRAARWIRLRWSCVDGIKGPGLRITYGR